MRQNRWTAIGVIAVLLTITILHYATDPAHGQQHDLFRRLYYIPVVWAALTWGLRGGLTAAAAATTAYLPHAFLMPRHMDPASDIDKATEMVLYFAIGGLAGWLIDSERRARDRAAQEVIERNQAQAVAARLEGMVHLSRGLAHEIRNPLGGIQGAIEILAAAVPGDSREAEMAAVGVREVSRLDRALGGFLQFARPPTASIAPFDASGVVRDVVALFGEEAQERGVGLSALASGTLLASGDRDQTTQVVINLVRNALEATPSGGTVDVAAGRVANAGDVRLWVRDTGCGIPAELGQAVYDPYVTGREHGTGLGLSIAASLVSQQGAQLRHRAGDEGGTLFWFDLPSADVLSGDGRPVPPACGESHHG